MILIKKRCIFFVTFLIVSVYVCVLVCVRSLIVWQILDVKFVFNVRKSMEKILRLRSCLLSCSDLNLRLNRIKMKFLIEKICALVSFSAYSRLSKKTSPGVFFKFWPIFEMLDGTKIKSKAGNHTYFDSTSWKHHCPR